MGPVDRSVTSRSCPTGCSTACSKEADLSSEGDSRADQQRSTPPADEQRWTPPADGPAREKAAGRSGGGVVRLLAHPLTLLLVTAVVSGLLVPRLTQQWQDHQQQLDTRRDFAARVSRTVGEIFVVSQLAQNRAESLTQEEFDDAYVRWEIESAVLSAELRAYYRAESLHQAWNRCYQLAEANYAQVGMSDPTRRANLQKLHDNLDLPNDVDLSDILVLQAQVLSARDQVIREVLDSPME